MRRRILRGSEAGRIRLVYEASEREPPRWLRFEPLRPGVVFHSDQGWGSYVGPAIGGHDMRVTPIVGRGARSSSPTSLHVSVLPGIVLSCGFSGRHQ